MQKTVHKYGRIEFPMPPQWTLWWRSPTRLSINSWEVNIKATVPRHLPGFVPAHALRELPHRERSYCKFLVSLLNDRVVFVHLLVISQRSNIESQTLLKRLGTVDDMESLQLRESSRQ
ncbi:hypothetical protein SELMODRAFT_403878 [Selaginella moellendorffii]|uniref:Uncharacterized protein n=1 Tax=Selaginella moellendorffii TaxID=88036 RepID=D8QSU7_SELML|nr:hypothetical protein SELMODRAFT_403878 [Selaginella moellendorffii]